MGWLADETGLDKCAANFVPLTPLSHLNRAADVYAARTALVYGPLRRSYAEFYSEYSEEITAERRRKFRTMLRTSPNFGKHRVHPEEVQFESANI